MTTTTRTLLPNVSLQNRYLGLSYKKKTSEHLDLLLAFWQFSNLSHVKNAMQSETVGVRTIYEIATQFPFIIM